MVFLSCERACNTSRHFSQYEREREHESTCQTAHGPAETTKQVVLCLWLWRVLNFICFLAIENFVCFLLLSVRDRCIVSLVFGQETYISGTCGIEILQWKEKNRRRAKDMATEAESL